MAEDLSSEGLESDRWLTQPEIAERLGCSVRKVQQWMRKSWKVFPHSLDLSDPDDLEQAESMGLLAGRHHLVRFLVPERDVRAAERAYELMGPNAIQWSYRGPVYDRFVGGGFLLYREQES